VSTADHRSATVYSASVVFKKCAASRVISGSTSLGVKTYMHDNLKSFDGRYRFKLTTVAAASMAVNLIWIVNYSLVPERVAESAD
jgi:hypothetical protein